MGLQTPISTSFTLPNGQEVTLETGKLAAQAHGSCVVKVGKMMIFASVVSSYEAREGTEFFPTVRRLPGKICFSRTNPRKFLPQGGPTVRPRSTDLPVD